ncbi:MAG: C40 family peptidase [Bacteroidota bacterium]
MKFLGRLSIFWVMLLVVGYPAVSQSLSYQESDASEAETYLRKYYSQVFGVPAEAIQEPALYGFIEEWLGTPYRYAGNSKKGIDCSGFANQVYSNIYCTPIPGGCEHIYKKVELIDRSELKEGDLVFFRINRRYTVSHVGVYLGNGYFAHASVKRGVMVSHLDEQYYAKYYTSGARVNFAK